MKIHISFVKKLINCFVLVFLICLTDDVKSHQRPSSFPYISRDTFRSYADFCFDQYEDFDPKLVQPGDVIFSNRLREFFTKKHKLIKSPYILVTSDTDEAIPGPYYKFLNHKKLISWFSVNIQDYNHAKLVQIPIGLAPLWLGHGNIKVLRNAISQIKNIERIHLLYLNFSICAHRERVVVYELLKDQSFCWYVGNQYCKSFHDYLMDIAISKFVLSPRGVGLDCHRTWESLLMGSIPILRTSSLDPLFENLPVLIINDWSEITEEFLEKKYAEIKLKKFNFDKLYAPYWINKIETYKRNYKQPTFS